MLEKTTLKKETTFGLFLTKSPVIFQSEENDGRSFKEKQDVYE